MSNRRVWATRVDKNTVDVLDQLAFDLGFKRLTGGLDSPRLVGNVGLLLDAIARGEFTVHANGPDGHN